MPCGDSMARVMVIDGNNNISNYLVNKLNESPMVEVCQFAPRPNDDYTKLFAEGAIDTVVYSPTRPRSDRGGMTPDLAEAEAVFEACAQVGISKVIVLISRPLP